MQPISDEPAQPSDFVKGHNGQLQFDGEFVTISRKGFLARTRVGKGEKRIPISQITAVQWKPAGLTMGYIQFSLAGGNEIRSRFGHQNRDANHDENSVTFRSHAQAAFAELRVAIEYAIGRRQSDRGRQMPQQQTDWLGELKSLGELRDDGVLTADEFENQKAILLGRKLTDGRGFRS